MTQPTQFVSTPSPFIADPSSPEPIQQVAFPSFDAIYSNQYTATADASPDQSDAWSPLAPPETVTPVPQPRKGPNVWLILGVVFLMVLLVGSGLFFLVKARGSSPTARSGSHTAPTAPTAPTATPGIGVPVVGGNWEVTLKMVHQETQLSGGFGISTETYTPNSGFTFLVVDVKVRNLASPHQVQVSTDMFAIISADGTISTPELVSIASTTSYAPGVASITSYGNALETSMAFVVKETEISQVFKLQFQKVPLIPFSLK